MLSKHAGRTGNWYKDWETFCSFYLFPKEDCEFVLPGVNAPVSEQWGSQYRVCESSPPLPGYPVDPVSGHTLLAGVATCPGPGQRDGRRKMVSDLVKAFQKRLISPISACRGWQGCRAGGTSRQKEVDSWITVWKKTSYQARTAASNYAANNKPLRY